MLFVVSRRTDNDLLKEVNLHCQDPSKRGRKPLFEEGYVKDVLNKNMTIRGTLKLDSVDKGISAILQEEYVIKEELKHKILNKQDRRTVVPSFSSKKTTDKFKGRMGGSQMNCHDENRRRQEELVELYNKVAAIVALRIALDNLASRDREGIDEKTGAHIAPYFYGLDGSGSFLGDALGKDVSIFVTHEAAMHNKSKKRSCGGTVPKDAEATQSRSMLYLNLVSQFKLILSVTFIKDSSFTKDIDIIQVGEA